MIDFAGLKEDYLTHKESLDSAIFGVLNSGNFIMGEEVAALESELKQYIFGNDKGFVVTCSNGTSALYLALRALDIKEGDEVITSSFSFFASAEMIALVGAKPIFTDINLRDFNLDINLVHSLITPRTKAILGISLFGQACDLFKLKEIASANNIALIEDGAQSFGAQIFHQDKWHKSLSIADISTTSFFPAKPLGCFGDGGAVFSPHKHIAQRIASLRIHAQSTRYHHHTIGISSRLDAIQAAILRKKLHYFDEMIKKRNAIAMHYLNTLDKIDSIKLPKIKSDKKSVFAQFSILADRRDMLQAFLKNRGIPTAIHYPLILPKQKAFNYLNTKDKDFNNAIYASQNILSLPINPYLNDKELDYITQSIGEFYGK